MITLEPQIRDEPVDRTAHRRINFQREQILDLQRKVNNLRQCVDESDHDNAQLIGDLQEETHTLRADHDRLLHDTTDLAGNVTGTIERLASLRDAHLRLLAITATLSKATSLALRALNDRVRQLEERFATDIDIHISMGSPPGEQAEPKTARSPIGDFLDQLPNAG